MLRTEMRTMLVVIGGRGELISFCGFGSSVKNRRKLEGNHLQRKTERKQSDII